MNLLFYQETGTDSHKHASAVVLLHGLFGMSDNLLSLGKDLATDRRVIIPDLANHGRSPHSIPMNYQTMARDVIELMDNLGIQAFALMGHSMGGKVAMQIASMYATRVEKLVIADIAPVDYDARHEHILAVMHKIANANITSRSEAEKILAEVITETPLRQFFLKNMARSDAGLWQWRFGLQEIQQSYAALSAAPEFHEPFNAPVLFIKGELSDYILPEHEKVIRQWFPRASLKVVQGAGHWLHAEKPLAFNRLVKQFLKHSETDG